MMHQRYEYKQDIYINTKIGSDLDVEKLKIAYFKNFKINC